MVVSCQSNLRGCKASWFFKVIYYQALIGYFYQAPSPRVFNGSSINVINLCRKAITYQGITKKNLYRTIQITNLQTGLQGMKDGLARRRNKSNCHSLGISPIYKIF